MQGIADWLKQLGLGQYTQRFAENEIDVTVLRHLTDQDLREIGVPLGHRRKILAAIREEMGSTTPVTSEPVDHVEPTSQASAERRQITVMFSDLVGVDGALGPDGPGGLARGHLGLSEMRR